jgi:hypothetical protein
MWYSINLRQFVKWAKITFGAIANFCNVFKKASRLAYSFKLYESYL